MRICFILHAAELEEPRGDTVDASSAQRWLTEQAKRWQLPCKIGLSSQMAARAMVVNDNPKLLLNRYSDFSQGS
ncbi:DUF1704 domain-containing protein [Ferrimonas lipolytica]|uniref:DUF1704 domain-containing protein n=1 Tax=Ferrimonas lipolytica TaxID=2724191 RepID=A0A6H1UFR0_9GAMM|nr:DUF1704 domain-containing protein [Ferrimonas lipolytica]QIZ76632.1 DUF1704 domain-containing protein [Ferrimonas lipolytica]